MNRTKEANHLDLANKFREFLRSCNGSLLMIVLLIITIPAVGLSSSGVELQTETEETHQAEESHQTGETQMYGSRSGNIGFKSTISTNRMDFFPDYNVEQALARVPGVQVDRRGGINLFGVGSGWNNVTIDGQRMASTGLGNRSIDLYTLPTELFRDIELIRVATPDMEADALAGTINLKVMDIYRPADVDRELKILAGGGANTRYFNNMGPGARFNVRFTDAPREDLTYMLNFSYELDQRSMETLGLGYGVHDFGNGPRDVYEQISPNFQMDSHRRAGGLFHVAYQPSEQSTFRLRGFFNDGHREWIGHRQDWNAGGDWIQPDLTGEQGSQGSYRYSSLIRESKVQQYNVLAQGIHNFEQLNINYKVGWAHGVSRQYYDQLQFGLGNLDYELTLNDLPSMLPNNIPLMENLTIDPRRPALDHYDRIYNDHVDNTFSGNLDVEIPLSLFTFKVGSSALLVQKNGDFNDSRYSYLRRLTQDQFHLTRHGKFDVFDEYTIPQFVDPHSARQFYRGSRPTFIRDERRHHTRTEIWNFTANEQIYSGYGMTTIEMGPVSLLFGARIEYTDGTYEGRNVLFDDIGSFDGVSDTSKTVSYSNIFPNAQLGFSPGERTEVRVAYSRSLARPAYNLLAPFEMKHIQNETFHRGNAELDPMISDNLNLLFDQYIMNTGLFTFGLFYKQLSGFVYEREQTISGGEYDGWQEYRFVNGDETATIYGAEVSWMQQLDFLPGFLSNLGTYANYTWSQSEFDVDYRDDAVALPGQSPHAVNAALSYNQARIATQVSWHWTDQALYGLQTSRSTAPSVAGGSEVYMDRYADGWTDLSISFMFRISDNFRFWADVYNLLDSDRIMYDYNRDVYPVEMDRRGGISFNTGIRYDL